MAKKEAIDPLACRFKRILIGSANAVRMVSLEAVSPNKKYGLFRDETPGVDKREWVSLDTVEVVDVLGDINEPASKMLSRLSEELSKPTQESTPEAL